MAAALTPVVQVLAVRFVTPPITPTMVQAMVEHRAWVDRTGVAYDDLGHLPRALVSSEDGWFWVHHGFDGEQICDAARAGGGRGASTLSQQVARNVFLWQGHSWTRKGLEAGYTVLLELLVPKERILELYANVAQTGPVTFGFEAGAQRAFGKPAAALNAEEAGRLVGILPNPAHRDVNGPDAAARARFVARNRVPFPGDPGYDQLVDAWAEQPWAVSCVPDVVRAFLD